MQKEREAVRRYDDGAELGMTYPQRLTHCVSLMRLSQAIFSRF